MCYNVGRTLENEQNTMIFIQEVKKMKIKRLSAIILAGVLTCTVPSVTYAADFHRGRSRPGSGYPFRERSR